MLSDSLTWKSFFFDELFGNDKPKKQLILHEFVNELSNNVGSNIEQVFAAVRRRQRKKAQLDGQAAHSLCWRSEPPNGKLNAVGVEPLHDDKVNGCHGARAAAVEHEATVWCAQLQQ